MLATARPRISLRCVISSRARRSLRMPESRHLGRAVRQGDFSKATASPKPRPSISVNTPDHYQLGSSKASAGNRSRSAARRRNHVRRGTVGAGARTSMLGYMTADAPGVIKPPKDGWQQYGRCGFVGWRVFFRSKAGLNALPKSAARWSRSWRLNKLSASFIRA